MAISYNSYDKIYYGTNAERVADTTIVLQATAKFFCYDTDILYVSNGSAWFEVS